MLRLNKVNQTRNQTQLKFVIERVHTGSKHVIDKAIDKAKGGEMKRSVYICMKALDQIYSMVIAKR